jgi:hypothetical protein
VSSYRQAPEATEIRAQEEVRAQDDEAREDRGPGDEPIREALETAAEVAEKTGGLGTPGRPVHRRSPFMIGLTGAFGVAVACGRGSSSSATRSSPRWAATCWATSSPR